MLYVAKTFTARPRAGAIMLGWTGRAKRANAPFELAAGRVLLGVEVTDQLAHGQHRRRGRPIGHHLLGEAAQRLALHLGVLEAAQDVLQGLEVGDRTVAAGPWRAPARRPRARSAAPCTACAACAGPRPASRP
jgi:hypothetical protein